MLVFVARFDRIAGQLRLGRSSAPAESEYRNEVVKIAAEPPIEVENHHHMNGEQTAKDLAEIVALRTVYAERIIRRI